MCLKEKETVSPPYSYHTFIFPFVWSEKDDKNFSRKRFSKYISTQWKLDDVVLDDLVKDNDSGYNQYQYFNKATRNTIYTDKNLDGKKLDDEIVWNYEYSFPDNVNNKIENAIDVYYYVIKKEDFLAKLKIKNVRLKLFKSNIGVLIFNLENHQNSSEEFINKVNDYGRRIFMPYSAGGTCFDCASSINIETPFSNDPYKESAVCNRVKSPLEHSIVYNLLFDTKKDITIEPIIDDRMFVACFYKNSQFINSLKEWRNAKYSYLNNALVKSPKDSQSSANRLYRYVFVDATDISCYSRTLLEDMLKKHIYHRWIEAGTISGISEYSMVSLTTNDPPPHLASAFLTEYVEMAILALAQRASLLNFERRLSDCTCGKAKIKDVHKDYLLFQSQLLLSEVTPQQQGIELYNMLRENLFIEAHAKAIEKQIQALYAQETSKNEKMENLILFVIAVIGVVGAVDQLCNWAKPPIHEVRLGLFFVIFIVLLFAYIFREKININFLK